MVCHQSDFDREYHDDPDEADLYPELTICSICHYAVLPRDCASVFFLDLAGSNVIV